LGDAKGDFMFRQMTFWNLAALSEAKKHVRLLYVDKICCYIHLSKSQLLARRFYYHEADIGWAQKEKIIFFCRPCPAGSTKEVRQRCSI